MARTQFSSPTLGLGLGLWLGLGLEDKLLSKGRIGTSGVKQRPPMAMKKGLVEMQRCLAWSSSWGSPLGLLLHSGGAGTGGGEMALGRSRNVAGFASEDLNVKRLYMQHQTRIAASNSSSSSFPGSPGVDTAAAQDWGEDPERYGDNFGSNVFENQTAFDESDSFPGGCESEQEHDDAEFVEGDLNSQPAPNGTSRDFVGGENERLEGEEVTVVAREEPWQGEGSSTSSSSSSSNTNPGTPSVGPKEPVYEVIEVSQFGKAVKKYVSRRQLLRTSGLRLRDLRRVDPSLWVTNSAPALLVRDRAILLNLGSLRAIATTQEVLIFDQKSIGAQAFMGTLLRRLNDKHNGPVMPFELEVIESALITRTQRRERALMDVEPRVLTLLEVLPTCMTADVLEDLRLCKQELVEVASKAGALRQMLLELLEHPEDIRRVVIMGRICNLASDGSSVDCVLPQDKIDSEDEEEEMEMLLEYYLQRCESCHGQALKLLSSAKEMEDSIAVNLSSRRLEVSRLELLLQVGTFCAALGALIAGIFGMNLKSYLEERALAFWFTTGGIIFGGIALFIYMFNYLSNRKIL